MAIIGYSELKTTRAAQKQFGTPTIGRGSAQAGGSGGGSLRVKYALMPAGMHENDEKTSSYTHLLAYKVANTLVFSQYYLTRYTPETFLRNTLILKFFIT